MFSRASSLVLLLGLSACSTASLQELRQARLTGDPFNTALAKEYLAFSESEAASYDWRDSKYFADKGLMAAYGQSVPPEQLETRDLPPRSIPELAQARQALLTVSDARHRAENPAVLARAHYGFDCWVEQQEEDADPEQITNCRAIFHTAMESLGVTPPAAAATQQSASTTYLVLFSTGSSGLDDRARAVLDLVLSDDASHAEAVYTINGHTDRQGSAAANMKLAEQRALAVRNHLLAGGIPAARMEYFAFGETRPAIETDDGAAEGRNRRVEILLQ